MDRLAFSLKPVAPFRLDLTVWALRRRAKNILDRWDGSTYRRVLAVQERPVEVEVVQTGPPTAPRLQIAATGEIIPPGAESVLASTLTRMLGTGADLAEFYRLAARRPELGALVSQFRGVKPPRFPTLFEALANAVICQQISLDAGLVILNRFASAFGPSVLKEDGPAYGFPPPENLSTLEPTALRSLGFSFQKARAVIELASSIAGKKLNSDELDDLDDDTAVDRLRQFRGIGRWSAEYALLRGIGRLEVFPGDDVGARKRLKDWLNLTGPLDYEKVRHATAPWNGYAGLVYFHLLLKGLDEGGFLRNQE